VLLEASGQDGASAVEDLRDEQTLFIREFWAVMFANWSDTFQVGAIAGRRSSFPG
jgi:hypothetical protein